MEFLTKLTLIQPNTPMHYNHYSAPTFLILFKKFLSLPPFTTEGRDDAFFTRDYKGETIKLLTFYMTDFLFTEPWSYNIWRKLKNHMKDNIPNIPSHLHISDPNLLQYEFHHIIIKFYHKIFLALWNQSSPTASGGLFFVAHKKRIFLNMSAKRALKN